MSDKEFESFVFIANDGNPYRLVQRGDQYWACYLHPDKVWVTHSRIEEKDIGRIPRNISAEHQKLYPPEFSSQFSRAAAALKGE